MKASIYFFTDFHFTDKFNVHQEQIDSISSIIASDKNNNIIIAVSGDLTQSGHSNEYDSFDAFLSLLVESVKDKNIFFVCCPGNHDIILNDKEYYGPDDIKNDVEKKNYDYRINKMSEYYAFQIKKTKLEKIGTFTYVCKIGIDDETLSFFSLNNVAFTCAGENLSSGSTIGHAFVDEKDVKLITKNNSSEKVVLLMHFPPFYFSESIKPCFAKQIAQNVDILLYGHCHTQETSILTDYSPVNCILGDAFHNEYNSDSGFVKIDLDNNDYESFVWDSEDELYVQKGDLKSIQFSSYLRNKNGVEFDHDFYMNISRLKCLNSTYDINDIYVFPFLSTKKYFNSTKNEGNIVDFDNFVKAVLSKEIVVIHGADKSGKTSLANYLTINYFNKGYIPILCKGQDLEASNYNLKSVISYNSSKMYANKKKTIDIIDQKYKRDKRVLIIDDYTYGDLNKLDDFFDYFGNVIVISNSDNSLIDNGVLSYNGEPIPLFYIEQMYKEKRKQLYRKIVNAIDSKNNTSKMSLEIFYDKMERFIKSLYLSDSFDPESIIVLAEKIYETGESYDNEYYSTVYQAKALINLNEIITGNYSVPIRVYNRLIGSLAYLMYIKGKSTFKQEDVKAVLESEEEEYGESGISISDFLNIGKKSLILRQTKNAEYTFYNRDIFSYYVAYHISENRDINDAEKVFNNDITVPVNFAIAMCLASINNIQEIPNYIVEQTCILAEKEGKLSTENFSLDGLTDEKIKQLKKLTKEEIDQITHEDSLKEQQRRDNYLQNKDDLFYSDIVTNDIKDLTNWLNTLKICCVLLSRFSDILKKPIKEKLIKLVLEIPNIILAKFNKYFFSQLDLIFASIKETAQGKTSSELIDELNSLIIDVKRSFILTTYDVGSRCFTNPAIIEMLSDRISKDEDDDLKSIQNLMLKSFITGQESSFISECMSIIENKKIPDYSFKKVASRLIGRQFYTRNNVYCDSKAKKFVKSIFNSYSEAQSLVEREKKRR